MTTKACPRLRIVRDTDPSGFHVLLKAYAGGKQVGLLTLKNKLSIGFISVHPSSQRCGVGTKLYERAAKIACSEGGAPMRSDIERTAMSQGFWEKQVKKGRATCAEPSPAFTPPSEESPGSWGGKADAVVGRGGCDHYVLKCPAPASLAGRRKKR